jgi:hypothetical protein
MFLHGSPERRPGGDRDTARTPRTAGRIDRRHLFQAAYAGPIIMMSLNRAAERDRLVARNDFTVNQRAEAGVEEILALLHAQARLLDDITRRIGPGDAT